jgi:2-polyprenyl-3-methyl-5-hydroxy-6-metoxy-1,4-benzoquinol methylase
MTVLSESAQQWELEWWDGVTNTFGEEAKQITYAHRMGLANEPRDGKWPVYDLAGKSVVDLGGGPVSLLLKTRLCSHGVIVDPCDYPEWVRARYEAAGFAWEQEEAETFRTTDTFDEAWTYNCLQHVVDPEAVIATAREQAKVLRIFEWIETETNIGHPHTLHAADLDRWIGGTGTVGFVNENGAYGLAYWGAFDL